MGNDSSLSAEGVSSISHLGPPGLSVATEPVLAQLRSRSPCTYSENVVGGRLGIELFQCLEVILNTTEISVTTRVCFAVGQRLSRPPHTHPNVQSDFTKNPIIIPMHKQIITYLMRLRFYSQTSQR